MGLVVITLQDEDDGTVSLGFTTDPQVTEDDSLTDAQILGMMGIHTIMTALHEQNSDLESATDVE